MINNKLTKSKIFLKSYIQTLIIFAQIVFLQIQNGFLSIMEFSYASNVQQDIEVMECKLVTSGV